MKAPIKQTIRLDWCDFECPCGSLASSRWGEDVAPWIAKHANHSDGTIAEACDDDWRKVYAERPADRVRPIQ